MNSPACCQDMDIQVMDLLFPERMSLEGQEFVKAHGVLDVPLSSLPMLDMGDGMVKIFHRCQHLQEDGKCAIYARRPVICRDYECSRRPDCACHGTGVIDHA